MESLSPSERSPLLDISDLKPEFIGSEWAICPGYLDTVLSIFQRHNHPFVLISTLAMRWSGGNNAPQPEIDVLVRSSHLQALVDSLVESGEWEVSENYAGIEGEMNYQSRINHTSICDVWLKSAFRTLLSHIFDFGPRSYTNSLWIATRLKSQTSPYEIMWYWRKSTTRTHINDLVHHYCDTMKNTTHLCYHQYKSEPRL